MVTSVPGLSNVASTSSLVRRIQIFRMANIEVSVDNGVVILNGTVNSRDEKKLTQKIAEEIPGVEDVENRIHVTLKGI